MDRVNIFIGYMILAMSLRERKKQESRQRISDVASALFFERGFDEVSVAEIAAAADVSKMTVFNYFPRKEDMFFDRIPALHELIAGADGVAGLQQLWLRLFDERHPLAGIEDRMTVFWGVVLASPSLRARAREIVEEVEAQIRRLLEASGTPQAAMTAALVVASARVCYAEAARRIMAGEPAASLRAAYRERLVAAWDAAVAAASCL